MKRFLIALMAALVCAANVYAQTPEEILEKMTKQMERGEKEGMGMTMTMKIPILGTFSTHAVMLGDKTRMEMKAMGKDITAWTDGTTSWEYDAKDNELIISDDKPGETSDAEENLGLVNSVTDGYDVKLRNETPEAWYFRCTKRKDNKDKDDPKRIDISVYKDSYLLKEMSTSMKGVTVVMKDFSIGVDEKDVSFDMNKFKNAKIIDKRGEEQEKK